MHINLWRIISINHTYLIFTSLIFRNLTNFKLINTTTTSSFEIPDYVSVLVNLILNNVKFISYTINDAMRLNTEVGMHGSCMVHEWDHPTTCTCRTTSSWVLHYQRWNYHYWIEKAFLVQFSKTPFLRSQHIGIG